METWAIILAIVLLAVIVLAILIYYILSNKRKEVEAVEVERTDRRTTEIYLHSMGDSERDAIRVFEQARQKSPHNPHTGDQP